MKRYYFTVCVIGLVLSGCGGSSGGGSDSTPAPSNVELNEGVYVATATVSGTTSPISIVAAVKENQLFTVSPDGLEITISSFSISDDSISGSGVDYINGSIRSVGSVSITGIATTGSITGSMTANNIDYAFEAEHVTASTPTLADLAGSYVDQYGVDSYTFDDDGDFFGSDSIGCIYEASIVPDETNTGLLTGNIKVSNCEFAGDYSSVLLWNAEQNQIGVIGYNATKAYFTTIWKQ